MNTSKNLAEQHNTPLQTELKQYLQSFSFEVAGTCTLKTEYTTNESIDKALRRWCMRFQKVIGLQVGYMGIIPMGFERKHVHLLMVGQNRFGMSLQTRLEPYLATMRKGDKDIPFYDLPPFWASLWSALSLLQPIYNLDGICRYIGVDNAVAGQYEMVSPYNHKLLSKYQKLNIYGGL